jgi:hypothetical protein
MNAVNQKIILDIYDKNNDKTTSTIYCGSCIKPSEIALKNANYFISLDQHGFINRELFTPLHHLFLISDRGIPDNLTDFKVFIEHIYFLISKGIIIHLGSVDGLDKIGLVLAALVHKTQIDLLRKTNISPVEYIQNIYHPEAFSTTEQKLFIDKNFSIKQ